MKIISSLFSCLLTVSLLAQAPQKMSYQAVIRQNNNQLVTNAPVGMQISILQGSASGSVVYAETHTPVSNANGLVSLEIGTGTIVSGTFAAIDWANGPFFIKMETDPTGGTNYTITGTTQLLSVPYALYAETAGNPGPPGPQGPQGVPGPSGSAGNFAHYIGELYGGGIIVGLWLNNGVEEGLIASLTNVSTSSPYSNVNIAIGPAARSPRDGQANTNAIIAQPMHTNSAAKVCNDYAGGGYTDWYLPSIWELNMCFEAAFEVNNVLGDTDGFQNYQIYWSSTEDINPPLSLLMTITYGNVSTGDRTLPFYVRAVRRF